MVNQPAFELPTEEEMKLLLRISLRKLRLNAGFRQDEIADYLQISRSTYSYYELGVTVPSVFALQRLSRFYSVPAEIFFTPDEVPDFCPGLRRMRKK